MIWARTIGFFLYTEYSCLFSFFAIRMYSEKDHRFWPMCNKSIPIKEYINHIGGCYNFDRTSTVF